MAVKHFVVWQVSVLSDVASILFIDVPSSPWSCLVLYWCSTCWCMWIYMLLLLISMWVWRVCWSIRWSFGWLSRLRGWLISDLLESITYSRLTFIHWNCRIIFIERGRLLIRLDKLFFIVNLMVSTESWRWFYERGSRIFAYAWRLLDEVIL